MVCYEITFHKIKVWLTEKKYILLTSIITSKIHCIFRTVSCTVGSPHRDCIVNVVREVHRERGVTGNGCLRRRWRRTISDGDCVDVS